MYDFHTHTFLSDGSLSPIELIRRAYMHGYKAIGITDHVNPGNLEFVIKALVKDCKMASSRWNILAIPGVEITHVPPSDLGLVAKTARQLGARLINVHGETIVEPVEEGTNLAAIQCGSVDILAHPGLVSKKEAEQAASAGVFLELSAKSGHSLTNGHVAKLATSTNALLLLDSDTHEPDDLLTPATAYNIAKGAGLSDSQIHTMLSINPHRLLKQLGYAD